MIIILLLFMKIRIVKYYIIENIFLKSKISISEKSVINY